MTPMSHAQKQIIAACTDWFEAWSHLSACELARTRAKFQNLPAHVPSLVYGHRAQFVRWLREVERREICVPTDALLPLRRWLQSQNQFLPISDGLDDAVDVLVRESLAELGRALDTASSQIDVQHVLDANIARFLDAILAFVREHAPLGSEGDGSVQQVVCAQYSPELQLRVLALDSSQWFEPMLDLGCGEQALLVQYLRKAGMDALGIDRSARAADGVVPTDWFAFKLSPDSWGTVISHLGFSNHFLHYHLKPGDEALRYARRYMDIVRSLRPGGTFAYAPGLPFIEEHLPRADYEVVRHDIEGLPQVGGLDNQLRIAMKTHPFYTCHVRRRACSQGRHR